MVVLGRSAAPSLTAARWALGRILVGVTPWAILAGPAVVALAATAKIEGPLPLVWAVSATPVVLLPAYPILLTAIIRRRRALFAVAAAVVAMHVALVAPSAGPFRGDPVAADSAVDGSQALRLLTANVFLGNDDIERSGTRILSADADVVLLQEVTPAHLPGLQPLLAAYPYTFVQPDGGALGFAVLSRYPMSEAKQEMLAGHPLVSVILDVAGRPLRVWDVHPPAPRDGGSRQVWARHLSALAAAAETTGDPLVIAGDFNATRWTSELGPLLSGRLVDAHEAVGRGLAATWPANASVPPFLLLDHVLISQELSVTSVAELPAGHSDHRPVVADLALRL